MQDQAGRVSLNVLALQIQVSRGHCGCSHTWGPLPPRGSTLLGACGVAQQVETG